MLEVELMNGSCAAIQNPKTPCMLPNNPSPPRCVYFHLLPPEQTQLAFHSALLKSLQYIWSVIRHRYVPCLSLCLNALCLGFAKPGRLLKCCKRLAQNTHRIRFWDNQGEHRHIVQYWYLKQEVWLNMDEWHLRMDWIILKTLQKLLSPALLFYKWLNLPF